MVREYTWRLQVRSYEGDAWGLVPASVVLRYLEHSAVMAAAEAGYGRKFHEENNSAWVIRRMTLLMAAPAHQAEELEISTWISNFAKVRGNREYRVCDAGTGATLYTGLAEWVYMDRQSLTPKMIPPQVAQDFDVPGAPLYQYDAPHVEPYQGPEFVTERIVDWHEIDSMGHVNNTIYPDWLNDAVMLAMDEWGWNVAELKEKGLHLRGEYYFLDYKRATLPGDRLRITTTATGLSSRLCRFEQSVATIDGTEVLTANSVYGWRDSRGEQADPPEGWPDK